MVLLLSEDSLKGFFSKKGKRSNESDGICMLATPIPAVISSSGAKCV